MIHWTTVTKDIVDYVVLSALAHLKLEGNRYLFFHSYDPLDCCDKTHCRLCGAVAYLKLEGNRYLFLRLFNAGSTHDLSVNQAHCGPSP